jgi:hypothetical protein
MNPNPEFAEPSGTTPDSKRMRGSTARVCPSPITREGAMVLEVVDVVEVVPTCH